MQRELQTDLFKEGTKEYDSKQSLQSTLDDKNKIRTLNDNFEALCRRMETFETRFDQITKNVVLRIERTMTVVSHVQTQINQVANDLNEKVVQLTAKINERRASESRVEDLIERHNTVVKAFETRMAQLHKMIATQEKQIHQFSAALNEARAENRRFRRDE